MKETFQAVADALSKAGFKAPLENAAGKALDYKITPYSLNTSLSFRFDNLEEFADFLNVSGHVTPEKTTLITTAFVELGLNPRDFFYVNFFEHGKEVEM
jgi:hypothetical protein